VLRAQHAGIPEGWIGEMTDDDRMKGVVAQIARRCEHDDWAVGNAYRVIRVCRTSACPAYRPVSYLYYFTTCIYIARANAMFLGREAEG
jgi:hypothetical protein